MELKKIKPSLQISTPRTLFKFISLTFTVFNFLYLDELIAKQCSLHQLKLYIQVMQWPDLLWLFQLICFKFLLAPLLISFNHQAIPFMKLSNLIRLLLSQLYYTFHSFKFRSLLVPLLINFNTSVYHFWPITIILVYASPITIRLAIIINLTNHIL